MLNMINGKAKRCPRCKKQVPLSMWSKGQHRMGAYCKPCMSQYYKERTEKLKKRKRGYW